jgi:hypothetical protein
MGTVPLDGPEATDWAAAGGEAGPGGDDQTPEDSGAVFNWLFFLLFFSPAFGWYPYQRLDGFFSFFFTYQNNIRGFWASKKKKKNEDPFYPR